VNIKKDTRPLSIRLWIFQKERAPLLSVFIMAATTVGVVYKFSNLPLRHYLIPVAIIAFYLLQIRTADEKKDFEHDNKFHKTRPVQRGVVTLAELAVINKLAIVTQLLLYASFMNKQILLLGLLSQGYAYLTKKEFFVREWIRQHFFVYYFSHYIQLVILFYAMSSIVRPLGTSRWYFVLLIILGVITTEVGRKMLAVEDDTIDDTYSAQLGHKGSALTLSILASLVTAMVYYFLHKNSQNYLFLIGPILVLGYIINAAYRYSIEPDRKNAKYVEVGSNILYVVALLSIIVGA
jgi:4-hydroxybenzoate polyprenyltransferase